MEATITSISWSKYIEHPRRRPEELWAGERVRADTNASGCSAPHSLRRGLSESVGTGPPGFHDVICCDEHRRGDARRRRTSSSAAHLLADMLPLPSEVHART